MLEKIGAILGSVRFWVIVLSSIVAVLNGAPLLDTIQLALAAVLGVGTLDSVATKFSSKKEEK